jgi:esterase/lipase
MAGKVEIFGGQLDGSVLSNAATESTLRELVNAINGVTGGGGAGGAGGGGGGVSGGAGGVSGGFKGIAKVASTLAGSLGSMTKLVVSGNQSLGTFVGSLKTGIKGIDKFTDAAAGFVMYFEEAQGSLRDLSKNGAAFNNSVLDLKMAASTAEMELTQFQKAIQMNSKGLLGYGLTLTQSAQRASRIIKAGSDSGVTLALMNLGMSSEESREYIMEFSASLAKSNRLRSTSDVTLAQASLSYYKELDAIAKITGKSREQQEEQMKEITAETMFRAKMARLNDPVKQKRIEATVAQIQAKQGIEAARIYRDQIIGVSVPLRKAARMQTALFYESTEANRRLADAQLRGEVSQDKINDVVNNGTVANAKAAKGLEHIAAVGVAGGESATAVAEAYKSVVTPILDMGENVDEVSNASLSAKDKEARAEQKRIGVMDKTLNQFQDAVKRVQAALERLKNTIMSVATRALEPLIKWAGEFFTKASHMASQGIDNLADWIERSSKQFGIYVDKWWFSIKEFFGPNLFTKAGLVLENSFLILMANVMEAVGSLLDKVGLGGPMLRSAKAMREAIEANRKAFEEAKEAEEEQLDKDKEVLAAKLKVAEAELAAIKEAQRLRRQSVDAANAARDPAGRGGTYDSGTGSTSIRDKQGNVVETRKGGHRNWRNNNPGNIEYGKFAISMGAIGTDGRFAIFPSMDMGYAAADALMKGKSYQNLSIADAIKRWAPPSENNTGAYQAAFTKAGFDITKKYSDLSPAEQRRYLETKMRIEGGKVGTITPGPVSAAPGSVSMSPSQPGFDFKTASREALRQDQLASLGKVTPKDSLSPGETIVPPTASNQESAVNPVANLNTSLDNMVALMREQITQQKNLVTAVKRLNGNVQTSVT